MYRKDLAYQEAAEPQARKVKTENFSFDQVKSLKDQIFQFKNPVISAHLTPDGDAYGSMIAMAIYLKNHGEEPTIALSEKDEIPQIFSELMIKEGIAVARSLPGNCDGVIILDTAEEKLSILNINKLPENIPIIEIDHHLTYPALTKSENSLASQKYSSTAELLSNFFEKDKINPTMAKSLVLGILYDTENMSNRMKTATTEKEIDFLTRIFAPSAEIKEVQIELYRNLTQLSANDIGILDQLLANISLKSQFLLQQADKEFNLQAIFISKKECLALKELTKVRKYLAMHIAQKHKTDVVLIVFYDIDKKKYRVSLSNFNQAMNNDLDLRLLVAQFNGGGQRGAVGFDFGLETSNEEEQKARLGVIVTKISEAFNNPK